MSDNLPFPKSLPDFQRLFPDDGACAKYLEAIRFRDGFVCPHCRAAGEPGRIATRPHVLRCRKWPASILVGPIDQGKRELWDLEVVQTSPR